MTKKYPAEIRDCAARMVTDRLCEYPSVFAAGKALVPELDVGPESLCRWVLQSQVDAGQLDWSTTVEFREPKRLQSNVLGVQKASGILKAASIFFVRELEPRRRLSAGLLTNSGPRAPVGDDGSRPLARCDPAPV